VKSDASVKNINHIKVGFSWDRFGALIVCPEPESKPSQYAAVCQTAKTRDRKMVVRRALP
jgi:hypothetical protein